MYHGIYHLSVTNSQCTTEIATHGYTHYLEPQNRATYRVLRTTGLTIHIIFSYLKQDHVFMETFSFVSNFLRLFHSLRHIMWGNGLQVGYIVGKEVVQGASVMYHLLISLITASIQPRLLAYPPRLYFLRTLLVFCLTFTRFVTYFVFNTSKTNRKYVVLRSSI